MTAHQLWFDTSVSVTPDPDLAEPALARHPVVEVRRSHRRRRTVSAYREGERTIVLVPARLSRAQEQELVDEMVARLAARDARLRPSDDELAARAQRLSVDYLDGRARPRSVRWAGNQQRRWGSCTVEDATIRLSTRLRGMPAYVVDYVLLHELAHLLQPGHDARFWALLAHYPELERAKGYLEGVSAVYDEGVGASQDTARATNRRTDGSHEGGSSATLNHR